LPLVLGAIDCVVAPVDQRYDAPLEAVRVTLPPVQNVVGPPAVIVGVAGTALTVTAIATEASLLQPFVPVAITA
jgi:hypothetical protein